MNSSLIKIDAAESAPPIPLVNTVAQFVVLNEELPLLLLVGVVVVVLLLVVESK